MNVYARIVQEESRTCQQSWYENDGEKEYEKRCQNPKLAAAVQRLLVVVHVVLFRFAVLIMSEH